MSVVTFPAKTGLPATPVLSTFGIEKMALTWVGNSLVVGTNTFNSMSFANQLQGRAPEFFRQIANNAVGGRSSLAVYQNLPTDFASGTEVLGYHEGTNDAIAGNPRTVQDHITNVRAICQYAIDHGALPFVVASAPVDSPTYNVARTEQYAFAERLLCESMGIPFVDPWSQWCDTDGSWTAAAGVTDGAHPPQAVHDAAAIEIVSQLRSRRAAPLLPRSDSGSAGVSASNALNLTWVSGVPTGWTNGGTAVTSGAVSTATLPVRGNWADQTITALTSSGNITRSVYNSGANFTAGERARVSGYFKFTNTSNMRFSARLIFQCTPGPNTSCYLFDTSTSFTETYFESEVIVPSNVTGALLWMDYQSVTGGSNSYTGTFSWAGFDAYNVSRNLF